VMPLAPGVVRAWLPPDANCLLSVSDHCFRSRNHVNLIVADKQPHLQYLSADEAAEHCARGGSVWDWAGTERDHPGRRPDVILACLGDVPTLELLAAAQLLREWVPGLVVRVVNVVDLMAMQPQDIHPHGFSDTIFRALFGADDDVVVAFHGYARSLHQLLHGRPNAARFHVRGFNSQGTTTTPFDMVVRNGMSRYHLAAEALYRARSLPMGADRLADYCESQLERHKTYVVDHMEDMPEVRDWTWS
jgi:xylulose-5-phosphate/fructose-6-phosphate phosphoketolase